MTLYRSHGIIPYSTLLRVYPTENKDKFKSYSSSIQASIHSNYSQKNKTQRKINLQLKLMKMKKMKKNPFQHATNA